MRVNSFVVQVALLSKWKCCYLHLCMYLLHRVINCIFNIVVLVTPSLLVSEPESYRMKLACLVREMEFQSTQRACFQKGKKPNTRSKTLTEIWTPKLKMRQKWKPWTCCLISIVDFLSSNSQCENQSTQSTNHIPRFNDAMKRQFHQPMSACLASPWQIWMTGQRE